MWRFKSEILLKSKELTGRLFLGSLRCTSFYYHLKKKKNISSEYSYIFLLWFVLVQIFSFKIIFQSKRYVQLLVPWARYSLLFSWNSFLSFLCCQMHFEWCFFPVPHVLHLISYIIDFLRTSPRESPRAGAWTLWQHHIQEPAAPPVRHVHLFWCGCRAV